jgi:hypothetical protein
MSAVDRLPGHCRRERNRQIEIGIIEGGRETGIAIVETDHE